MSKANRKNLTLEIKLIHSFLKNKTTNNYRQKNKFLLLPETNSSMLKMITFIKKNPLLKAIKATKVSWMNSSWKRSTGMARDQVIILPLLASLERQELGITLNSPANPFRLLKSLVLMKTQENLYLQEAILPIKFSSQRKIKKRVVDFHSLETDKIILQFHLTLQNKRTTIVWMEAATLKEKDGGKGVIIKQRNKSKVKKA